MGILAGIGLGLAAVSWIVNLGLNSSQSLDEKKSQVSALELENELYVAQQEELTRQLEYQTSETNIAISDTLSARDTQASIAAQSAQTVNQEAYDEYNNLRLEATQAMGSLTASTATSGFRNTGTKATIESQTESRLESELASAKDRASLTIATNYLTAAESYSTATKQADAYSRELAEYQAQYEYEMSVIDTQVAYNEGQIDALNESISASENNWFSKTLRWIGSWFT